MIFGRRKPQAQAKIASSSGSIRDTKRGRDIAWLASYPKGGLSLPIILLSHGGEGNTDGYKSSLKYVREALANAGYLAINIQHKKSKDLAQHLLDKPEDVRQIVNAIMAGEINVDCEYNDDRIGHVGHSTGSYTGMALAGGQYDQGSDFQDLRISAFASLSPQGPGEFGSRDDTWDNIFDPVYFISGTKEDNKNGKGWRKIPFINSPDDDVKYWSLVNGMDHQDLGKGGTSAQSKYVSSNIVAFFDFHFKSKGSVSIIGTLNFVRGTEISNSQEE